MNQAKKSELQEKRVLGEILLVKGLSHVRDLKVEDFLTAKHQVIFQVMQQIDKREEALDILSVGKSLLECNKLEDVGGYSYITEIEHYAIHENHIPEHMRQFVECVRKS